MNAETDENVLLLKIIYLSFARGEVGVGESDGYISIENMSWSFYRVILSELRLWITAETALSFV